MNPGDLFNLEILKYNTTQDWLIAALIMVLSYLFLQLVKHIAANKLQKITRLTKTDVDDFIVTLLAQINSGLLVLFSIYFGSLRLQLGGVLKQGVRIVVVFALLLQMGFWLTALINFWVQRQAQKEEQPGVQTTTLNVVALIVKVIAWVLIFLLALDNIPGVEITTLIASLGIGGIAVGLAVQSILSDIFASATIALDKPFVIGDVIAVDDLVGTVEHIGLKSVRVRSLAGQQIIFSTSDLLSSRINNYQQMERRRVVLKLGVSYNTPQQKVARIPEMITEIISEMDQVTLDRSHLAGFGDFALNFETVYYIEVPDMTRYMDVQQAVGLAILKRFEEEGIEMPYPTHSVLIDKMPQTDKAAS